MFNSSEDFFERVGTREPFRSSNFKELLFNFAIELSDRKASQLLNRVRHEPGGISPTTLRNVVEREGLLVQEYVDKISEKIFDENDITINKLGSLERESPSSKEEHQKIPKEDVKEAAKRLEIENFNLSDYELSEESVNIAADGIGVKRQTECRPKEKNGKEQRKTVSNAVVHVQRGTGRYILNASSIKDVFKYLTGFLVMNCLLDKQLVFFVDGARDLNKAITSLFSKMDYKIILDWYHLRKKCYEQLSLALRGSKIRNEILEILLPPLWYGKIDKAVCIIQGIDKDKVKNQSILDYLLDYLERVRDYVPCYALRKELGLRNSSGSVEKANDLVVANRQKHNGMSWSNTGSVSFASISTLECNNQLSNWIRTKSVAFVFNNVEDVVA